MHPPGQLMHDFSRVMFNARKGMRQKPPDKGPVFPGRIRHVNTQRLGDKAGDNDGADKQKNDDIIGFIIDLTFETETVTVLSQSGGQGDDDSDQNKQSE